MLLLSYIIVPARVEKLREVLDLTSAAQSRGYLDILCVMLSLARLDRFLAQKDLIYQWKQKT